MDLVCITDLQRRLSMARTGGMDVQHGAVIDKERINHMCCSQASSAVDPLGFGLGWLPVSVTFPTVVTKCLTEIT